MPRASFEDWLNQCSRCEADTEASFFNLHRSFEASAALFFLLLVEGEEGSGWSLAG